MQAAHLPLCIPEKERRRDLVIKGLTRGLGVDVGATDGGTRMEGWTEGEINGEGGTRRWNGGMEVDVG